MFHNLFLIVFFKYNPYQKVFNKTVDLIEVYVLYYIPKVIFFAMNRFLSGRDI